MNPTRYPANQAETQDDQPTTASEQSTVPGGSPYPADGEPRYDEPSSHQESPYPGWDDEPEEEFLPPRPRSRLFRPATVLLFAALMASAGFLGGVLTEKRQLPATTAGASTTRSLASTSSGRSASSGAGGAAASANSIVGQVSTVSGGTLYVTDSSGNTIKVTTSAASQITKTAAASVRSVHPGDTVVIQGAAGANGTIAATAVRDSGAGAATGGFGGRGSGAAGSSTGAGSTGGSSSTGTGSGAGSTGGVNSLFGG